MVALSEAQEATLAATRAQIAATAHDWQALLTGTFDSDANTFTLNMDLLLAGGPMAFQILSGITPEAIADAAKAAAAVVIDAFIDAVYRDAPDATIGPARYAAIAFRVR